MAPGSTGRKRGLAGKKNGREAFEVISKKLRQPSSAWYKRQGRPQWKELVVMATIVSNAGLNRLRFKGVFGTSYKESMTC
jgi:hypothetical protein